VLCTCFLSAAAFAQELQCELNNPALQAMPPLTIEFSREDGSVYRVSGKLADNNTTRAAGFQRVCYSTIEASPILFSFDNELMPKFHMNNVVEPLDVAFIDKNGRIESIQLMKTYVVGALNNPLYGPNRPIVAVFEAHKGFFAKHNLDLKTKVAWFASPDETSDATSQTNRNSVPQPAL